jgi:molybdopterin molybdotransferase
MTVPRTVTEHQQAVIDLMSRWGMRHDAGERIPLLQARGRLLSGDVTAPINLPGFDNSQMDGYAVDSAAFPGSAARVSLEVAKPIAAGSEPPPLKPGTAAPIMTGAMMPAGADAVVPIEAADPASFFSPEAQGAAVELRADSPSGQYVRAVGSDIAAGTRALRSGTYLGAAQLGLLAALGLTTIEVRRRPEVLLLTTGDEVVEPGQRLSPGQIYDANTTMLHAALEEAGVVVRRTRVLADSVPGFRAELAAELRTAPDLVLSTGGISKGAYEVVRQGLAEHEVEFLSVAMQPGGPQGIGTIRVEGKHGIPFLGFPGNPVSALVSFEMFLRPALGLVLGVPAPRREVYAVLSEDISSPAGKYQVRRGRYQGLSSSQLYGGRRQEGDLVSLVGGSGSHLVHALAESNALVHIPEDQTELRAGDVVRVWLI